MAVTEIFLNLCVYVSFQEIDTLRTDNMRLKDENSALLRVVSSLSGTGGHGGHHRR